MKTTLDNARTAIAQEIGSDAAEFTPQGEKNFVAAAALAGMAGSFLYAFLKAVANKAVAKAEERIGESVGDAIGEACKDLLKRLHHEKPSPTNEELEQARAGAAANANTLTPAQLAAIRDAVTAAMTAALSKQSDPEITRRVVETVGQQAILSVT